ncbi:UDP-2,3-diacylglucosamine hydrolase [Serratia symbiotica str. 'Cinara cedri']|nr:UDP-2,3-diacylglucosamine hydrolase [Serratia symbiotica str. 'Cinara cedri']
MSTLFISDLHLCPKEPEITLGFLRFLEQQAIYADALYILGDLFKDWIGDDDPEPLHYKIAAALKALQQAGVPSYFMHGNRDFLLGAGFAKASSMKLLPEIIVLELYGRHILILHGDILCIDDQSYQKFRRKVRHELIQKIFLALPLSLRLKIVTILRTHSQQAKQCKPEAIMDVNRQAVEQVMLRYGVQWMIHGHTHRPAIHLLELNNSHAYRVVLGAWHIKGSMTKVSADSIELISFQL